MSCFFKLLAFVLFFQYHFCSCIVAQHKIRGKNKYVAAKDVFDVLSGIFRKEIVLDTLELKYPERKDSVKTTVIAVLPSVNYSVITKWAFGGFLNGSYYLNKKGNTNMSTSDLLVIYTLRQQLIAKLKSTTWTKDNGYNLIGDWRFMKYPSFTFGLGSDAAIRPGFLIDYSYLRVYQTVYRELSGYFYIGIGYKLDYHYNVKEYSNGIVSDFDIYTEGNQGKTLASGPTINFLYDSRENLVNPLGGRFYGYLSYRYNSKLTGSSTDWQSITLDARKYIKFPTKSTNILALWSYNWFTFGGNPSYLDLPSTGWDAGDNQGRGYIQGRFRSNNLLSLEAEYRFSITRNKLLGGVVFSNVQTVSEIKTMHFKEAYPAAGAGIRLKINKHTNSNLSIDVALGVNGSKTIFVNLGEIF